MADLPGNNKTTKKKNLSVQAGTISWHDPRVADVLFSAGGMLVVILDHTGTIIQFNGACEQLTGYKSDEVKGRFIWDIFIAPEESDNIKSIFSALHKDMFPNQNENYWLSKDGTRNLIRWFNSVLEDENGEVEYVIGTGIDITDRENARAALKESKIFYHNIFNTIQEGISVLDMEMNILQINEAMSEWYKPSVAYIGEKCYKVFHNRNEPCMVCPVAKAIKTGKYHEVIVKRAVPGFIEGWLELRAYPMFDSCGKQIGVVEIITNITSQKVAEEALKKSEEKYRLLAEHISDVIWTCDLDFNMTFASPSIENLTGYTVEEVLNKSPEEFITQDSLNAARNIITEELTFEWENPGGANRTRTIILEERHKNGSKIWTEARISFLRDSDNQVVGFVGSTRDITRKKQLEDALKIQATTDALTGISNRRFFFEKAINALKRVLRYQKPLSLLMIDIDHFKQINDKYGHPVGDRVLKSMCHTCMACIREIDLFGRIGGEEFAIVMEDSDLDSACEVAERLRESLSELYTNTERGMLKFTVSIGVAALEPGESSFEEIMKRADMALYKAKNAGRNRVVRG